MTQPHGTTLVELLEELAAWVKVPAPPEPRAAEQYSVALRAAAARIKALLEHDAKQGSSLVRELLHHINGGE